MNQNVCVLYLASKSIILYLFLITVLSRSITYVDSLILAVFCQSQHFLIRLGSTPISHIT